MLNARELTDQIERMTGFAVDRYGELKHRKNRPPLNQLVLGLLCELTSVRRATRALRDLKRTFVDWNEVRVSHPAEVAGSISSAPWARQGAERAVWLLKEVFEQFNRADLDFLGELTVAQAHSILRSLTAVARQVTDQVLLFSLDVPVLPCSEGAARLCWRLGVLESDRRTVKNQQALQRLIEKRFYPSLCLFFSDYADKLCRPEDPICGECPMEANCPWARQAAGAN